MQTIYDAKILIVDDNQDLLNLVTTALRSTGYNQLTACTGCAAAQAAFAANRPDLMILDINLPDGDGFTLFRTLHSMADIPALFLSARDADADRLFGLGLGADDYLVKPFEIVELLARVEAVLRRAGKSATEISIEGLTIDTRSHTVMRGSRQIPLTAKEFELLLLFVRNRNIALFRETIYERVWGSEYMGDSRTVDLHVQRLRKKLHWDDKIKTIYKVGYRLEI